MNKITVYTPKEQVIDMDKYISTLSDEYNVYLTGRGINADVDFITRHNVDYTSGVNTRGNMPDIIDELMYLNLSTMRKINKTPEELSYGSLDDFYRIDELEDSGVKNPNL